MSILIGQGLLETGFAFSEPFSGRVQGFAAAITGITTNPFYGATAQDGNLLMATVANLVGGEVLAFQWRENGVAIGGGTSAAFTPEIGVNVADLGSLDCVVTVDGVPYATAAYTVRYAQPNPNASPTIAGGTSFGAVLAFTGVGWTGGGIVLSRQWYEDDVLLVGENGTALDTATRPNNGSGRRYHCSQIGTSSGGTVEIASNTITMEVFAAPVNTVAPVVSGSGALGDVATVSDGTWTANPAISGFTYRWLRNSTAIAGATANSYAFTAADDNAIITCEVTPTNAIGSTTAASSNAINAGDYVEPAQFGPADWAVSDPATTGDLQVTITNVPAANPVTDDIEYQLDGGAWIPTGGTVSFAISGLTDNQTYSIALRGTNDFGVGAASAAKNGTPTAAPNPAPVISNAVLGTQSASSQPITLDLDQDASFYGILTTFSQSSLSAAQLKAGLDQNGVAATDAYGPVAMSAGSPSFNEQIVSGLNGGGFYINFLASNANGDSNIVELGPMFLDTTAPAILTTNPADNTTDVALSAALVIDFDDDMLAAGTVTLRVVGGAAIETFTLSSGTGDNGGSVALSAGALVTDRLTITPGANLASATEYALRTAGLLDDKSNPLPDVVDDTTISFTTVANADPVFLGIFAGGDSVTLEAGKTYGILAAGYSSNMTAVSAGANAGSVPQEHSFSGRRACVAEIVATSAYTGALSWTATPGDFALYDTAGKSFLAGLNGPNGNGGPNLSINTNAGDFCGISGYEFGDRAHTWASPGITWRKGGTLDGLGSVYADKLVALGGTPEAFDMDDNGAGLSSCIGRFG